MSDQVGNPEDRFSRVAAQLLLLSMRRNTRKKDNLKFCKNVCAAAGKKYEKDYENMPVQYTEIFKVVKNENFQ